MKKIVSLFLALVLCFTIALPAFAVEGEFVPSVSYKDAPEVVGATMGEEDVDAYLIVTSLLEAIAGDTEIPGLAAELQRLYNALLSGEMTLPLDTNYTIRDLFDIRLSEEGTELEEELEKPGVVIRVVFDLNGASAENLVVMHYKNDQWIDIPYVVNEDGTITCTFENFCPVVFAVKEPKVPSSGDLSNIILWISVLAVSTVAMGAVVFNRRKFAA